MQSVNVLVIGEYNLFVIILYIFLPPLDKKYIIKKIINKYNLNMLSSPSKTSFISFKGFTHIEKIETSIHPIIPSNISNLNGLI